MRLSPTIAFAAALLPWSVQAGMYGQPVLNLDARTFKQVMANEHAAMVAFVAPWCGHCRNLGPEYTAAASSLSPLIPFYAVDCDDQANKPLCAEYQIQGFPTIKAFPRAGKGAAKDYQGERKKGALIEYAKTLVPDRVKKLRVEKEGKEDAVIKGFLKEKPDLPHVLLVHPSAPSIPFLWKVLAHRLSGKMHLGFVRDTTSHTVLSSLGVFDPDDSAKDATRVVAFPAGATSKDGLAEYQGALKFNALLEWLQGQLDGTNPPSSQSESKQPKSTDQAQKTIKAESATTDDKKAKDAAARRAKMDEAERRDKERRERAAAAAAAKSAAGAASVEEVEGDTPDAAPDAYGTPGAVGGSGASKVEDAPEAVPQETVDPTDGGSSYDAHAPAGGQPADPSPEQAPAQADGLPDEAEDSEAEKTEIVHEEL